MTHGIPSWPARTSAAALAVALAVCLAPGGLGHAAPGDAGLPTAAPILLVGIDGLEWDVVLPLLAQGRLPHFERLMKRGSYGKLETFRPTFSPVVWTTVVTGKVKEKHGIHHFARRKPEGGRELYDSSDRKVKAIWNILSDAGLSVSSVGWWMTYPVEPLNGVMVAQTNTAAQFDTRAGRNVWKGTLLKGVPDQVYPPERQNEMISVMEAQARELPGTIERVFGTFAHPRALLGQRLWDNCLWAFRADATYLEIALRLANEGAKPDLTLVYFGGPDVVGHRFWRYREPGLYSHPPTAEQIANFGGVIDDYYAYTDQALGRLIAAYGPEATILVVSDHGMRPVNLDKRFDPNDPPSDVNSAEHQEAPPGLIVAAGPFVRKMPSADGPRTLKRSDLTRVGSVLDITPTLLALLRLPLGGDMDGQVLAALVTEPFAIGRQPAAVASHDTPEFLESRGRAKPVHPGAQERIDQLRALGYIGE